VITSAPVCFALLLTDAFLAPLRFGLSPSIATFDWMLVALLFLVLAFFELIYCTTILIWFLASSRAPWLDQNPAILTAGLTSLVLLLLIGLQFPVVTVFASLTDFAGSLLLALALSLPRFVVRELSPGAVPQVLCR
jgi:hypothetical protein